MISFLLTVLKIVFLLGFLVLIHEGGHFLIAKLCKVKVNEFAIGFGPTIWKKQGKETKYALRAIPLGGFVSMEGEEERSEEEGSFSKASIPKRIAIVIAGGTVNIIFGLLAYFILGAYTGNYISNKVESIQREQTAIQVNDEIIAINDKKIRLHSDIQEELTKSEGNPVKLDIIRNGEEMEITETPLTQEVKNIGISFEGTTEELNSEIAIIFPDSPAERAGLQAKDTILQVNGEEVKDNPVRIVELIRETEGKVQMQIQRGEEIVDIEIEPEILYNYTLGITMQVAENNFGNNLYYAFWDTADFSVSIIDNLKLLFTGNVSMDQLMGPVGISETVAQTASITEYVYIIALISLSLGVTNLLPFPPLDGGKIVFLIIEGIRRKPLKESVEMGIQAAGFLILILLSLYVAYNDVLRIF
mgnify:FL=1